jgi:hypothetical protein
MEEISRQITALLLPKEPDKNKIKNLSNNLLTTADEKNYVTMLQGLVHKVFKEEWVKAMLARGVDPEAVMVKIDEHWDQLEQGFAERHPEGENYYGGIRGFEGDRHSRGNRDLRGGKHFEGDRGRRSKGAKGGKGGSHFAGDRYETRDRRDDKHKGKDKKRR